MKHLLVVNVFFSPRSFGGATVVAEEVTRRLAATGDWHITVLSFSGYGTVAEPALIRTRLPDGNDHYTINFGGQIPRDLSFENPAISALISDLVRLLNPDCAHVHCIQNLGIGVIDVLNALSVPIVLSTHDYWWLCERNFMTTGDGAFCDQDVIDKAVCAACVEMPAKLESRWQRAQAALSSVAVITYPSHHARAQHERNGAPHQTGVVVPNGVTPPSADYSALRASNPSRRIRFGYIGGSGPLKGWPMIERAFRALDPKKVELVLVDAASNIGASWWRNYDFGPISQHVTIVPGYTRATIDEFYAGLDVLLFLSTWKETFGLTSREAALRGIHVVATDCGAPVEPLTDGDTATILPGFGSAKALREALKRLVHDGLPVPSAAGQAKIENEIIGFDEQAATIDALLKAL